MKSVLSDIISSFSFDGEFISAEPLNCGNINDTYITTFKADNGGFNQYILQRINHKVFKEPDNLMKNVIAITRHIQEKVIEHGGNPSRETLNFIPMLNGSFLFKCNNGNFWRAYSYIDDVTTYQVVENPIHLYNAGRALGRFQKYLSDFTAEELYETIPDFHNTPKRYQALQEAIEKDVCGRVETIRDEIIFVEDRSRYLSKLVDDIQKGNIPLRVTHNDTKFNNVLIDNETGEGICVIDLDTVMPGSSLYDFGDSIRSGANPAGEEELDLSKVSLDMELFNQFTKGFMEYAHDFLNNHEIDYLPFSAILITLELGMRFLTDYINGDIYFKTNSENQNLHRAQVQFKLVVDMEAKYDAMRNIVNKYTVGDGLRAVPQ